MTGTSALSVEGRTAGARGRLGGGLGGAGADGGSGLGGGRRDGRVAAGAAGEGGSDGAELDVAVDDLRVGVFHLEFLWPA